MINAFVAYFHFLGIMLLLAALVGEHLLLSGELDAGRGRQLVITDVIYIVAVALVLVSGLLRLIYFGKGLAFYTSNPLFHVKMTLFVVAAVLSVYPTVQIRGLRPAVRSGQAPGLGAGMIRRLKLLVRVELMLIATIPLLAVLMGRGFGY
jgi:putative membrane protein